MTTFVLIVPASDRVLAHLEQHNKYVWQKHGESMRLRISAVTGQRGVFQFKSRYAAQVVQALVVEWMTLVQQELQETFTHTCMRAIGGGNV